MCSRAGIFFEKVNIYLGYSMFSFLVSLGLSQGALRNTNVIDKTHLQHALKVLGHSCNTNITGFDLAGPGPDSGVTDRELLRITRSIQAADWNPHVRYLSHFRKAQESGKTNSLWPRLSTKLSLSKDSIMQTDRPVYPRHYHCATPQGHQWPPSQQKTSPKAYSDLQSGFS